MNHRMTAAALALLTTTAGLAVATTGVASSSASPDVKSHTVRFVDKKAGKAIDAGPLLIQADDDYSGKTLIGTDEINCTFGKTSGACLVTLSLKGGFLYGHFTESPKGSLSGTITGGAGAFKGATGTISGKADKPITVTYRT